MRKGSPLRFAQPRRPKAQALASQNSRFVNERRPRGLVNEGGQSQVGRVLGPSPPATRKRSAESGPQPSGLPLRSGRTPARVRTYTAGSGFHKRRCEARRVQVSCPENVHHGSAQRRCGSCCRPARFKFPGVPAFRLAGSSLRRVPIGGFEKHVRGVGHRAKKKRG